MISQDRYEAYWWTVMASLGSWPPAYKSIHSHEAIFLAIGTINDYFTYFINLLYTAFNSSGFILAFNVIK